MTSSPAADAATAPAHADGPECSPDDQEIVGRDAAGVPVSRCGHCGYQTGIVAEHTDGPDCPACLTHENWVEHHCYGCGRPYDAETAELLHRAFHSESLVEQNDAIDQLAARPSEHKDCLQ